MGNRSVRKLRDLAAKVLRGWRQGGGWRTVIWCVALWGAAVDCNAAQLSIDRYTHTSWDQSNGLSANTVYSIAQATDGRLWIATEFGLDAYDGFSFEPAIAKGEEAFRQSTIQTICAGPDNSLWVGTTNNLAIRSGMSYSAVFTPGKDMPDAVTAIDCKDATTIYAATEAGALYAFNAKTRHATKLADLGQTISDIARDGDSVIVATLHDGIHRCSGAICVPVALPKEQIESMIIDGEGVIWAGTAEHGLIRIRHGRSPETMLLPQAPAGPIWSIAQALDGAMWVSVSGRGVVRFTMTDGEVSDTSTLLIGARVARFDRSGDLWIGTTGRGLHRLSKPTFIPIEGNKMLSGQIVTGIASQTGDQMIVGARDGGLFLAGSRGVRQLTADPQDYAQAVVAITPAVHGANYVLRRNGLWAVRATGAIDATSSSLMASHAPQSIGIDEGGELWLARSDGRVTGRESLSIKPMHLKSGAHAHVVDGAYLALPRSGGELLVTATASGLIRVKKNGALVQVPYDLEQPSLRVGGLFQDSRGETWIYFQGGRLGVADGNHIRTVLLDDSPSLNTICSIVEDDQGNLYLSSNIGVLRIARASLQPKIGERLSYRLLDESDGMASEQCSGQAARSAHDGSLWFATARGIARLPSNDSGYMPVNHSLKITTLLANGSVIAPTSLATIGPGIQQIGVRFSFTELSQPTKVRFRHRLIGGDTHWTALRAPGLIEYEGLTPGEYEIVIQAKRAGEAWGGVEATQRFNLLRPFVQGSLFFALCTIAVVFLGAAAIWTRTRIRARRASEFQRRDRLARDLHDTIAQGFSGMLMRLQVALHLTPIDQPALAEQLMIISNIAGGNLAELRDVVAQIRAPDGGTTIHVFDTIEQGIRRHLSGTDIDVEFEINGTSPRLSPFVMDNTVRIVHEAVSNAIMHAQTKRLIVRLCATSELRIEVEDSGIGIQGSVVNGGRAGTGLRGMQVRAQEIAGRLDITPCTPGTRVTLYVPMQDEQRHAVP